MSKIKFFWLGALAIIYSSLNQPGWAQDDWEWWIDVPAQIRLSPAIALETTGSVKLKDDMSYVYNRGITCEGKFRLNSWFGLGAAYWYRQVRPDSTKAWAEHNTWFVRVNLNWSPLPKLLLKELNRIEYDSDVSRWRVRIKPQLQIPFELLSLKWRAGMDNEFFFYLDYPNNRSTFSENRFSLTLDSPLFSGLRLGLAYRLVGIKNHQNWDYRNVLTTCIKFQF